MRASPKFARGRPAKNMQRLASEITKLQSKYQQQARHRQEDIAHLLSWVDLTQLDDAVLMGAFLFIQNKVTTQDPILEDWNGAGARFLRQPKTPSLSSFSTNAAPQTTHQTSQKHPESEGEPNEN